MPDGIERAAQLIGALRPVEESATARIIREATGIDEIVTTCRALLATFDRHPTSEDLRGSAEMTHELEGLRAVLDRFDGAGAEATRCPECGGAGEAIPDVRGPGWQSCAECGVSWFVGSAAASGNGQAA